MTPPTMSPKEELFAIQAQIKVLEERRRVIYAASLAAPATEKVCEDGLAEMYAEGFGGTFEYPVTIHGITHGKEPVFQAGMRRAGTWVAVRPCDDECAGKTYLGMYLGDAATAAGVSFNHATGVLEVGLGYHNPAIWVFDLKRIVYGMGSWWGPIKWPEDLRQITNVDVNSVWYVRALQELSGTPAP